MVELEIAKLFIVRGEPDQVALTVYALLEMMRVRHDMEAEKCELFKLLKVVIPLDRYTGTLMCPYNEIGWVN